MKALVVDDDRTLADVVAFTLRREGYQIIMAYDGETALRRWEEDEPDLIVLDVNLPKLDGFAVCKHIRQHSDIPIILLTVRGEEDDVVHGLEIGADDYIPKPFSPRQLVARAQAVLRRAGRPPTTAIRKLEGISLHVHKREVYVHEQEPTQLTRLECRLLDYLMLNAGHVLTTEALIEHLWGAQGGDRDMLRQIVHRLRNKIEENPSQPHYIETVPGIGYGLALPYTPS